jgi:hypothetical protein
METKMAPKQKKPPAPSLEQEAKAFIEGKDITKKTVPTGDSPTLRAQLAASVLAGLLSSSNVVRAEELVEEAFRYADLILEHK